MKRLLIPAMFLLSSCGYIDQLQVQQQMDADYAAYLEKQQAGSPVVNKLHQAVAQCTQAQIHITPDIGDVKEQIIPVTPEDLAVIKEIFPRVKSLPPLSREAWQRKQENPGFDFMHVSWNQYTSLEFLDANGKVLDSIHLNFKMHKEEEMGTERHEEVRLSSSFMLPTADWERFYALPSIKAH